MRKYYKFVLIIIIGMGIGIYFLCDDFNKKRCVKLDVEMKKVDVYRKPIVALIDTGCDLSKKNIVWKNTYEIPDNGIDDDKNGYVDDLYGWNFIDNSSDVSSCNIDIHGNCMLNIIELDYIQVMILKVLDENESGNVENVIEAIKYAENNGAVICNLSFITYQNSKELEQIMKKSSMLFVVAAGNEGEDLNIYRDCFPVCYQLDNMITVASCDKKGKIILDSNYGNNFVDVAALGDMIKVQLSDNQSTVVSGTSVSTALVTKVAAIIYACSNEEKSSNQLKSIICSSLCSETNCKGKVKYEGIVSLKKTVEVVQ